MEGFYHPKHAMNIDGKAFQVLKKKEIERNNPSKLKQLNWKAFLFKTSYFGLGLDCLAS